MKFWKVLRWLISVAFVLLVVAAYTQRHAEPELPSDVRLAPTIVR